jgi:drug/metabolite transporter (DMT)-like permease
VNLHLRAVFQALFVTFLWSTSWVLIKIGLGEIPALTFAGLRYSLAFLILLPYVRGSLRRVPRHLWGRLVVLGLVFYTVTQGAQFLALSYLPAVTVSLLLSFSVVAALLIGAVTIHERPTRRQVVGMALYLLGVVVYFYPPVLPAGQGVGVVIALVAVLANAVASVLGREVNRSEHLSPGVVTAISMGIGAAALLVSGIATQGMPELSLTNWLIILWLAAVNTAFAFTLWNHTLRTLSAFESSVINNTMLIQIAVLAWLFLGETITLQQGVGMGLAAAGILIVQLWRGRRAAVAEQQGLAAPSPETDA